MLADIPKHDTSKPHYQKFMEFSQERLEQPISWLTENPRMSGVAMETVGLEALTFLSMDSRASEITTWEAWTTWMQVAEAPFAMCALEPGQTTERLINQKIRTLRPIPLNHSCNAGGWLTAFFLAVTCRDEQRVASLCQISPEFIREASEAAGGGYDEYIYPWITALQDFILNRPTLGENLYQAMDLSRPKNTTINDAESLDSLVFPLMNSFYRFAQQDTAKFNEAMEQALRLFHAYYTADEERAENIYGTIPTHLFGIACLAYDLAQVVPDFDPDLVTPYFPKHILERSRHGEMPI
ncbi:immunity 49 family protein [Nocardiopsis alba]|uniref:immunity 49 family protein n=1 Tax=Nocardiopsis alba TaxID=53437 RepID=UPI00364927AE